MIENEFFNEVKKRKVEYQQKLNDVTPPELEGIGGRIDIQFRTLTECLFSWINCHHYQSLLKQDRSSSLIRKQGEVGDDSRLWLIKQTKKSLTQMSKRFNKEIPYLNFKFQFSGYINWLKNKKKTNSLISHNKNSQHYSPEELIELFGGEYSDECCGVYEKR